MAINKLFLPDGARVSGSNVVLPDGSVVPGWACVAVPVALDKPAGRTASRSKTKSAVYYDLLTGRKTAAPKEEPTPGTGFDVGSFDSAISLVELEKRLGLSLPKIIDDSTASEVDPGYFEMPDGAERPIETVTVSADDVLTDDYALSDNYTLGDALVWRGRTQSLVGNHGRTAREIAAAAKSVAVNVLEKLDEPNQYVSEDDPRVSVRALKRSVYSWIAQSDTRGAPDTAFRGETVTVRFDGATTREVYRKSIDAALKLPFDYLWLDYRSAGGPPMITVTLSGEGGRRRVGTRYDDKVVSTTRLLNCDPTIEIPTTGPDLGGSVQVQLDPLDDYWGLFYLLSSNPALFGGTTSAQSLMQSLGFVANPFAPAFGPGGGGGGSSGGGVPGPEALSGLQKAVVCPDQTTVDPKLFPTGSHPAFRHLSDLTQLDDDDNQTTLPYTIRTNNPLGVKTVKGVTDLKTRFGYLGDSEGVAVYRDHVGGAAAGLNYLMTQHSGSTLGSAAKESVSSGIGPTLGQAAASITQHLFGAQDPSGVLAECATVGSDVETTIGFAAAMAKSTGKLETSPLTHAEWASAYQIAKNQPNGGLTKTTTGVPLPAQEQTDSQDTGPPATAQGKETDHTTDLSRREDKWNPVANYDHYAQNVWKSWIDDGILTYEKKAAAGDKTKMAKANTSIEMAQDTSNPTTYSDFDWDIT